MNPSLAFDTSALVSLGHTELIELILDNYNVIISDRILIELTKIGERNDKDARAANKWLEYSNKMELKDAMKSNVGEEELYEICQREKLSMVTDDVKATKNFEDEINWIFSVHIVFLLYYKGIISKERAIFSIEKIQQNRSFQAAILRTLSSCKLRISFELCTIDNMRLERSWKNNIISVTAKIIFQ